MRIPELTLKSNWQLMYCIVINGFYFIYMYLYLVIDLYSYMSFKVVMST
jgi:hypothetical protein